ncbi:MAG: hypothetical protein IIX93_10710 [Clostridia bacterium]|nr:hypothetical protein [Clostridia bacterium]
MKICTSCQKTFGDDMRFCSECGHELAPAPACYAAAEPASENVNVTVDGVKGAMVKNVLLNKLWPILVAVIGYAISWAPDGNLCFLGTLASCAAAVAVWLKPEGKVLCKSIPVRVITTVIGAITLIEFLTMTN